LFDYSASVGLVCGVADMPIVDVSMQTKAVVAQDGLGRLGL
jgi:hypothetical protein